MDLTGDLQQKTPQKVHHKVKISSSQEQTRIKQALLSLSSTEVLWEEKPEQYCDYRLEGRVLPGWGNAVDPLSSTGKQGAYVRVKQYTNGTFFVEASQEEILQRTFEAIGLSGPATTLPAAASAVVSKTASQAPTRSTQLSGASSTTQRGLLAIQGTYIGTDESGKGDYFGPLVTAGVVVNDDTVMALRQLGVQDSKALKSGQIEQLARAIQQVVGPDNIAIIEIGPTKYNQLYASFKARGQNLNHLLAWGHATAIESLLEKSPLCTDPSTVQAIADQFGSEHYIERKLKTLGKQITLHQTPKAEANIGVAAASILARHRFVTKLQALSAQVGITLPLGAGAPHAKAAEQVIQAHGAERLATVAKLHFKTTDALRLKYPGIPT